MTWKEIKDKLETNGVEDEDTIKYIDIAYDYAVITAKNADGSWEIYS